MSLSILHFINPFASANPKEQRIHRTTLESIERAAAAGTGELQLTLGVVQQEGSSISANKDMFSLPVLKRSVKDFGNFPEAKPYPLIADIIDSAKSHDSDFYIFTNMDIGLMPDFYKFISDQIVKNDYDAFIINRRRIPETWMNSPLNEMYNVKGKSHPGFDCFVMSREIMQKLVLSEICVGIPFVGVALAHNIFAFADNPKLFDNEHLTFHLGMDIFPPRNKELYWHNRRAFFRNVAPILWPHFNLEKFPYKDRPPIVRLWLWIRNPSLFTIFYFRLLKKRLLSARNK